jgi:hypothetical protein
VLSQPRTNLFKPACGKVSSTAASSASITVRSAQDDDDDDNDAPAAAHDDDDDDDGTLYCIQQSCTDPEQTWVHDN